jgi:hypothetical protein
MDIDERRELEAFVVGNQILDQIERHLAQFNLFEAVGAVRSELRHSDFLGFLLDPSANHGLSDFLLKELLKDVVLSSETSDVSPIAVDIADLRDAEVRREWRSIDLLVLCPAESLVLVIENKVDAVERPGQTSDYRALVETEFSDYSSYVFVFLSPGRVTAEDESWSSYSYSEVVTVLDRVLAMRGSVMGPDVVTTITHYTTMLRRHIVSDSEIADLCRQIYAKHRTALDLIFEHRPDIQLEISGLLIRLAERTETEALVVDTTNKSSVRFAPSRWDATGQAAMAGSGWTASGRVVLFEWNNASNRLELKLIIGPGPADMRERVFEMSRTKLELFVNSVGKLSPKFTQVYKLSVLTAKDYEGGDWESISQKITAAWESFSSDRLKPLAVEVERSIRGAAEATV